MTEFNRTDDTTRGKAGQAKHASLMKRANTLARQGMYDEAIANIKQAIALRPQDPRCSVQLANVYRAQNMMGPAIEAMQRAFELDPANSTVHEQLLRILLEIGRYDDAIKTSYVLLSRSPRNVFARDILGIAYLQQGMLDKALKVTNELILIDPTDACHYFKKAVLLQQKGQIAEAMTGFTRVVDMDPEGEMADDAREAIAALDSYQLRQILTIAVEDAVFRTKLAMEPEPALSAKGFRLSGGGLMALKQIDLDELPGHSQSRYYH